MSIINSGGTCQHTGLRESFKRVQIKNHILQHHLSYSPLTTSYLSQKIEFKNSKVSMFENMILNEVMSRTWFQMPVDVDAGCLDRTLVLIHTWLGMHCFSNPSLNQF